jgi:apolipoprotein N-acyltransferase
VALAVALAGGLALAAAFPPVGIWPLAPAGPALLAVALWRRGLGASLLTGLVFGLAFFVPLLSWLLNVAWYAWLALAASEAVIFAVLAVGQRVLLGLRAWPLAVAGWWVCAEALRARWPYAFPWGRLAMSQAGTPAAPWAAIGGAPLLTFLVALAGATLAWALLIPGRRRAMPWLVVAAAVGLALAGSLLPVDRQAPGTPTATVAAVQGNVPHARNLPDLLRASTVTTNHVAATERLAAQVRSGARPAPDLVIWPENAADLDPRFYPEVYARISAAVNAINRPVLVGTLLADPVRNASQLWLPGRGPVQTYVKRQLVPFGEYIPFRGLLKHITSLVNLQPQNFTAGHRAVVFRPARSGSVTSSATRSASTTWCPPRSTRARTCWPCRPTTRPSRWTGSAGRRSSSSPWPGSVRSSRTGRSSSPPPPASAPSSPRTGGCWRTAAPGGRPCWWPGCRW